MSEGVSEGVREKRKAGEGKRKAGEQERERGTGAARRRKSGRAGCDSIPAKPTLLAVAHNGEWAAV